WLGQERREIVEIKRKTGSFFADPGDDDLGAGMGAEQPLAKLRLGRADLTEQVLELGELTYQLQYQRYVGRDGRFDPDRHLRSWSQCSWSQCSWGPHGRASGS